MILNVLGVRTPAQILHKLLYLYNVVRAVIIKICKLYWSRERLAQKLMG